MHGRIERATFKMALSPCWPVSGLAERLPSLPRRLFEAPSGCVMRVEPYDSSADRCGGSAGLIGIEPTLLLPVELRHVNHAASTNGEDFKGPYLSQTLQSRSMPNTQPSDTVKLVAERVERLLVRHEELQRTNALLNSQVEALTRECESLKSRLSAARARVDALLERLPGVPSTPSAAGPDTHHVKS